MLTLRQVSSALLILTPLATRELFKPRIRILRNKPLHRLHGLATTTAWSVAYALLVIRIVYVKLDMFDSAQCVIGYAALWAGALLRRSAYVAIGDQYSEMIVVSHESRIVSDGPYRILRHPLHLGLVVEIIALTTIDDSTVAYIVSLLSVMMLPIRNAAEEKCLRSHFGAAYDDALKGRWDIIDAIPETLLARR